MSDLYRINLYAADAHDYDTGKSGPLHRMISDGVLVPIEPCRHGFLDAHWAESYIDMSHGDHREYRVWCDAWRVNQHE